MIQNNRTKILLIVIVILTIINIAAVATIFLKLQKHHADSFQFRPPLALDEDSIKNMPGPAFMMDEIGFDQEQRTAFRNSRMNFRKDAEPLFREIRELNAELIDEIANEDADTGRLASITNRIGSMHTRVKQLTVRHLQEVKLIATPEQQKQLRDFYRELITREGGPMEKSGKQYRYRHGQKRNNQFN